jgi:hypothetical protein
MIDQLSEDEISYIENRYGPIEFNPDYQPTRRESVIGITLFTGNRLAHGVHQEIGKFVLINVEDVS